MEIVSKNNINNNLINHPYENNLGYFSKINFLFFLKDRSGINRVATGYWEAPEGHFDYYFKSFNEVAYILEGKIEIVSDDKTITVRGGDCYLMKIGDRVRYNIKSYTKAFWFTFPVDSSAMDEIDKLINTAKNSGKMIS